MSSGTNTKQEAQAIQRLPVNHRRRKVAPGDRKRVVTACNYCNLKRLRCSGEKPCARCKSATRDCEYPTKEQKVLILQTDLESLQAKCNMLEKCLQDAVPEESKRNELMRSACSRTGYSDSTATMVIEGGSTEDDHTQREGRILQDPDGIARYMGGSSGAVFLDYLKEFMAIIFPLAFNASWSNYSSTGTRFLTSLGQYQTADSCPLRVPTNIDPFWLPSITEASIMLANLRYLLQDGNGDFASGGIYFWGNMEKILHIAKAPISSTEDMKSNRSLAMLNIALAASFHLFAPSSANKHLGESYFARSRVLLGNPLDLTTIEDIPILALMGLYLLGKNRRDAAYIYVSIAMHISVTHSVHRGWMVDEQGKRIFWTLYILDRWLSCLMGRPPTLSDEAIKIDMPQDTDDTPPAAGLRAHVQLSRISSYIVCNVYQVALKSNESTSVIIHVEKSLKMLSDWLKSLPAELQNSECLLQKDRASCELFMAYNQLLILTTRPILFVSVKKAVVERYINGISPVNEDRKITQCNGAARHNIYLARLLLESGHASRLLHTSLHHIFNAVIIMELHQLLLDKPNENDASEVAFAIRIFQTEAELDNNYAKDCAKVLLDLDSLVQRLHARKFPLEPQVGLLVSAQTPVVENLPLESSLFDNTTSEVDQPQGNRFQIQPITQSELQGESRRDGLYNDLLTWLNDDDLQRYYNPGHLSGETLGSGQKSI